MPNTDTTLRTALKRRADVAPAPEQFALLTMQRILAAEEKRRRRQRIAAIVSVSACSVAAIVVLIVLIDWPAVVAGIHLPHLDVPIVLTSLCLLVVLRLLDKFLKAHFT